MNLAFFVFLLQKAVFRDRRKAFHSLICIEINNIQITKIQQFIMNKKTITGWLVFIGAMAILAFLSNMAKKLYAPIDFAEDEESEATVTNALTK